MNNFKNLKLVKKESNILNNIECYEMINRQKLDKLLLSNLLIQDLKYKNVYETEKEQLLNYLSRSQEENIIKVKYTKQEYGRSNPLRAYGLFNIRREIRQTISRDYYEDIDIQNAHPIILQQILESNNIKCIHLTNYNNDRDKYLNMVMNKYNVNRDDAKKLFIIMLYGGSYEKWLKKQNKTEVIKELLNFNNSMWEINKTIVEINPELNEWVLNKHMNDKNKKFNYHSSVVAFFLQEKEVQILEQLYIYSTKKQYIKNNNVVLCADGIMIPKENFKKEILNKFEKLIQDKFDIKLTFVNKEMNEYYSDDIINSSLNILDIKKIDEQIELINNEINILKKHIVNINDIFTSSEEQHNTSSEEQYNTSSEEQYNTSSEEQHNTSSEISDINNEIKQIDNEIIKQEEEFKNEIKQIDNDIIKSIDKTKDIEILNKKKKQLIIDNKKRMSKEEKQKQKLIDEMNIKKIKQQNVLNKRREQEQKNKKREQEQKNKLLQINKKKKDKENIKLIEDKEKKIQKLNINKQKILNKHIELNTIDIIKKKKSLVKTNIKEQIKNDLINDRKQKIENETLFKPDIKYMNVFSKTYMNSLETYVEMKIYFEIFICKILRPSCVFLYLEKNKDMGKEQCFFSQKEIEIAFREYKSDLLSDKGKLIPFIKVWLDDINLRSYNESNFIPFNGIIDIQHNENVYNLFNGYNNKINSLYNKELKHKILNPFLDLCLSLCGDNQIHSEYFIKFIAHMIQKPNEKIGICFIFQGKQGTGKNMLLSAISNIIGKEHYITSSNPKDFFGDYAEGFYRKLLVNMNECEGKDTFDFESKIKSFITEDSITINQKYIRPSEIRNVARIIITTNKPNPIPIDVKSIDRRFVVYKGSERFLDKKNYGTIFWEKLNNHFNSNEFIACLYDYFNNFDLSKTNWKKERPITEAYKNMCRLYNPVEALFFDDYINFQSNEQNKYNFISEGVDDIINPEQKEGEIKDKIRLNKLCETFNEWLKKNGFSKDEKGCYNIKKFRSQIETLEIPIKIYKSEGFRFCKWNDKEVITFLKNKKWIDRNEDEEEEEDEEEINQNTFDDMFNFNM